MATIKSTTAKTSFSQIQLEGGGEITTSLSEYVLKALPQDLLTVLRGVAYQELNAQVAAGNPPSQVLVDGRSVNSRGIESATRSVSIRFADSNLLMRAAEDAYAMLMRVTRMQTPAKNGIVARQNFFLWVDGKMFGQMPGALSRLRATRVSAETVIRVVGPLVPYGRKLYWNPIGRNGNTIQAIERTFSSGRTRLVYTDKYAPRFKPYRERTLRRIANQFSGNKAEKLKELIKKRPGYAEGMHQIVKRLLRRNRAYAPLHISDGWVNFAPSKSWGKNSRDSRVPSVSVQLAKRGKFRAIRL